MLRVRKIKRRRSKDFVQIFKGNPSEFKVKLVLLLDRKTLKLYYLFNSCLNVEGTFLIAYLDCKSVTGLVVYILGHRSFDLAFKGFESAAIMAFDSELLLTEYLLNFEDENAKECSFETEGFSSGVECSDDEQILSSLKETLTSPKKAAKKKAAKRPTADRPGPMSERYKKADQKERKRIRDREYKQRKAEKAKSTERECIQLRETNKVLSDKNIELGDKVSSLEKQVEYLENIIANESALSAVLGAITKHSGLSFNNNSLGINSLKRKRVGSPNDENEPQTKHSNGGVCVHLTPGRMSLEFCRECDLNASVE